MTLIYIWLYCDKKLNFTDYKQLKESMIEINRDYSGDDSRLEYLSLSTLDHLVDIGKFKKDDELPPYNSLFLLD